ncbi:Sn1-specific diacylglycerol lipase alpha [Glycine soja]
MILSRVLRGAAGKLEKRPAEAPQSLMDIVLTLAEAIRFGYAETLGTWHLFDLPRAILYTIMDKGKKTIPMECGERSDCVQLKDPKILDELYEIRKCLTRTMLFSKKRFRAFLLAAGIPKEDVLLRKKRARILKPAFTVIRDKESKCLLVFIRGTQSLKDTLTDAIGAPVSFNHFICSDDGELKRNNKVSGHGHRGMVAAARWIKKHCTTILLEDLRRHPDFQIKLAEFGKPFITSIINDSDIVPTLSAYSIHDFIFEGQIKHKKILNAARSAVVSRLPFASTAKAIADHAVTRGTQNITASTAASDEELLNQLEKLELEKHDDIPNIHVKENQEATTSIDVTEEEKKVVLVHTEESAGAVTASYNLEKHPLYPPGRIMHIVPAPSNSSENSNSDDYDPDEKYLYLYETPKQLYGKLRAAGKLEKRPAEAPKTLMDTVLTLAEAIRFGYAETLGKWHLLDLPRAILYSVMDKGKKTVAVECAERSDCVQLKDPELLKELYELKKCLTQTMLFSKKRFRAFLFAAGFVKEDVLLRKRRARILKPAFTVILNKESKCLLVFIRGTRSIKDTLTDAIGAPVSFSHFICSDGELKKRDTVSGHGHRGMVAAARWIKKHCTTILLDALRQYPDFQIKIVGHSLGGGTAALLTFMLRETKQFASCTCVTFGPAACMSFELAEFGKPFITSIINGYDIVPTLSGSSVHDFVAEGKIKRKKILNAARSSITAIGSRLPFASTAKAIADHAVTRGTQVVMKNKQKTRSLLPWSRREKTEALPSSKSDNLAEACGSSETSCGVVEEIKISDSTSDEYDESKSSSEESDNDVDIDEEEQIISAAQNVTTHTACDISENDLLNELKELELEAQDDNPKINAQEKEGAKTKDITEEEINDQVVDTKDKLDTHLYPPGRIMHIIPSPSSENNSNSSNHNSSEEKEVYLYETPRQLYGKLRLSRGMIIDHLTRNYLKVLQQLINQLEKEKSHYGG